MAGRACGNSAPDASFPPKLPCAITHAAAAPFSQSRRLKSAIEYPPCTHLSKPIVSVLMMSLMANLTLVYGLRLLPEGEVTEIQDATLKLANGHQAHVTMHVIDGSREEIETQLKRSLDAFFDFYPEI